MPLLIVALALAGVAATTPVDTYPRQPLDVEHYRFALTLADSTDHIEGLATVRMRLLASGLRSIWLDLANVTTARQDRGMRVSYVARSGTPLVFTHADDRLIITLDHPSTQGEVVDLTVRYDGVPADGLHIASVANQGRTFFSDDWPNKAHQWLPTIDHIADKATMEMDVVAPARYQVISN